MTYEILGSATVLGLDVGFASLVDNLEGAVLSIGMNLSIAELATDETLCIENGVVGVHRDLVLGSIADQTLVVGEGDIRGSGSVTLVVGNDFDTSAALNTNARVGRTQI